MYNLKHGCSIGFNEYFEERLEEAEKAGFYSLEFGLCALWPYREKEKEFYKNLRPAFEKIKNSSLVLNSVHISFGLDWEFSSPNEAVRVKAMDNLREILPVINEYAPNYLVIHPSFEPIDPALREAHKTALVVSINEIKQLTSIKIAIENLPRTCLFNTAEEGLELLERIGGIYACVDVNHFLFETPQEGIKKLGKYIVTTHISDYDFIDERHLLPTRGKIDWTAVIKAFEEVGYDGVFNSEITLAPRTDITVTAVKRCFENLFLTAND